MTDTEIIEGILHNDHHVFKYVYQRLAPIIMAYVLKNKGSLQDSKDLFQETFIQALLMIRKGQYKAQNFKACFFVIARNKWISGLRKKKPHFVPEDDWQSVLILADELDEEAILQLVVHDKRLACIETLWETWDDTPCQKRLQAFYYEGKKYKEIAEDLGLMIFEKQPKKEIDTALSAPKLVPDTSRIGVEIKRCRAKLYKLLSQEFPQYFKPK